MTAPGAAKKPEKCTAQTHAALCGALSCGTLMREPKLEPEMVKPMIERYSVPGPHTTGKARRRIYVYVPDTEDPEARFPVLYMFDGHNVFFDEDATYGKSWGMLEYMESTGTRMMIVAADCNHRRNYGRLSEYSPFSFHDEHFGTIRGHGQSYMNWLCGRLKPYIDRRYPTLPERETTFIAGSSMGGLMSLYALAACPDVFSRAAALSPSVWVSVRGLEKLIAAADFAPDAVCYMDYGSRELDNHNAMLEGYLRVQNALMRRGVYVSSRIVPHGDHCEACWEEQIPFFMQTLLYDRE